MKNKRAVYFLIGLILIIITVVVVLNEKNPAFYDPLGFITFAFLIGVGIYMLRKSKNAPEWIWFILILIGIIGLIVDGSIVFREFLLN
jgi:peptidoglycan/LPS O-acetylase OafA/YrhL